MSTEAKVGAFTVLGLLLLMGIVVQLSGYGFGGDRDYRIQAVFGQVNGLKAGNLVRYAGVDVGKVVSVEPDGRGALVTLSLRESVKIPSSASVTVGSDGLVGEKFVAIFPGEETGEYLPPNAVLKGVDQRGLDHLMATADDVLADMRKLIVSFNEIFGDDRVRAALIDSAVSAKEMMANLNRMSAALSRMSVANEQDVRAMVQNLSAMSDNMASAAATVDRMLADIDNDGRTAEDLKAAVANLSSASRRVEHMAASLEDVVADPETAENLWATLRNARGVSEKADRMMRQVSGISTEFNAEVLYSGGADRYQANAEMRLHTSPEVFLLLGVDDIGEADKVNAQIGRGGDKFAGRFGVFENKAGLGADAYVGSKLKLSVDAYDPNEPRVKLRAQYEFAPDTFLVGQTSDINRREDKRSFLGVRRRF